MIPSSSNPVILRNGSALNLNEIPELALDQLQSVILQGVSDGHRVVACFGCPTEQDDAVQIYAILAHDSENQLSVARTTVHDNRFPSLTPRCPQVHLFEREIAEQFGLQPEGHPWLKPVRYHRSWREGHDVWNRPTDQPILPGSGDFYRIEGEEVHEVAVGPIHAGIIEPGHFRFQCHGEEVFHLEIALGYQHRGVEKAMIGGPNKRSIHYAETLAGDSTIAHATAHCQIIETLANCQKPVRAQLMRGVALELERLANHIGDLGAMAQDVGFLPTSSYCGRLRGDFLNMTALLCGNRFGRGMICPGGVGYDADASRVSELLRRLDEALRDTTNAVNLLWDTPSVMARFEDIGPLAPEICRELGLVGPVARASGLNRDVRQNHPSGIYRFVQIPISTWDTGDVFARAYVRWQEIQNSVAFIRDQIQAFPGGTSKVEIGNLAPNCLAISLIEGWRGEICHVAITDQQGQFSRYKIVDPSFHNWIGLSYVLRGQQISDFPICNKSFNLSYCGHDL